MTTPFIDVTPTRPNACFRAWAKGLVLPWASWECCAKGETRDGGRPVDIGLTNVTEAPDRAKNAYTRAWALINDRQLFAGKMQVAEDANPQTMFITGYRMLKDRHCFFFATLQLKPHASMNRAQGEPHSLHRKCRD